MKHRYSKHLTPTVYFGDFLILNFSIIITSLYYLGTDFRNASYAGVFFLVANISWLILSALTKASVIHRPLVLANNINRFLMTVIYYLAALFCILYISGIFNISRFVLIAHFIVFFLLVIIFRSIIFFVLDYIRKKGYNHRKVLIIGDKVIAQRLKQSFAKHPEYGYDICGYISEAGILNYGLEDIEALIVRRNVDEIYICNLNALKSRLDVLQFLKEHEITVKIVSDLDLDVQDTVVENYEEFPVFRMLPRRVESLKIRLLKRGFDLGFASVVMFCGAPVFALITIITKSTSKGPVFYKQQRIGRNGKPFFIYKFRSMYVDAESMGPQLSKDNDPRITKWGLIMRKTRLDELPQFYNVFRGDMSVVGPRPERQHFIEQIIERAPRYNHLLSIKPGITSIGQVRYGYAENVDQMIERMEFDLIYLGKLKLRTDMGVIMETVKVMVAGKGK